MKRGLALNVGLMAMVALLGLSACATETVTQTITQRETVTQTETVTQIKTVTVSPNRRADLDKAREESRLIAEEYVKNSPTFRFDGIPETLELVETVLFDILVSYPYWWEFAFSFQSRHAGYGNRTGQLLAQVITTHTARITVQEGEVVRAIMDDKWDMMQQKMLES